MCSAQQTPCRALCIRFALADIVLRLAENGSLDPQWLADTAVRIMPPSRIEISAMAIGCGMPPGRQLGGCSVTWYDFRHAALSPP